MIDIKTGKEMSRGNFLKGGLAAIIASGSAPWLAGSANATVGGMMRNVGGEMAAMFGGKSDPFHGYSKNGLIAFWDVDSGQVDLVGGIEAVGLVKSNDYLMLNGNSATATFDSIPSVIVIDIVSRVFSTTSTTSTSIINAFNSVSIIGELRTWTSGFSVIIQSYYYSFAASTVSFISIIDRGLIRFLYKTDSSNSTITYGGITDRRMYQYYSNYNTPNNQIVFGKNANAVIGYKSVRIYNRYLTSEESSANYEIDKARFGLM